MFADVMQPYTKLKACFPNEPKAVKINRIPFIELRGLFA